MIIKFNSNLILWETEKALLVKLPKTDYQFWVPKKLCKSYGKNGYSISMFVPEGFEVKAQKMGKGSYNKNVVIAEMNLKYSDFISYFGYEEPEEIKDLIEEEEC